MKTLLLVGRGGNGKRTSADSINIPQINLDNLLFLPVVCSGVGDIGEDLEAPIESVVENVRKEIEKYEGDGGFDAISLVLKYGVRFTQQEKDAVEVVRSMFGENVLRDHGIIIMTYGDLFEVDNVNNKRTFKDWCMEQLGAMQTLLNEVEYRIVLLDNKTDNPVKRESQLNDLQRCLSLLNRKYRLEDFNKAEIKRTHLVVIHVHQRGCNDEREPLIDRRATIRPLRCYSRIEKCLTISLGLVIVGVIIYLIIRNA
ncbi:protein AIG1 [Biomphalaria glabrata]|nr:protein AIG1 [Biomphalaria glabrata]